jgi:TonB family protein
MNRDPVRDYYKERMEKEGDRLAEGTDGAVEFEVNRRTIERHLPAGARVLSIGDEEGSYALWLAGRGDRVVMAVPSPEELRVTRGTVDGGGEIEEIAEADARDLSRWPDASFDAVLCLDSTDRLLDAGDRERVASEIARILRPEGIAFVALATRYELMRRTLTERHGHRAVASPEFLAKTLGRESSAGEHDHADRYGVQPDEVNRFFERHGLAPVDLLASEGIAAGMRSELAQLAKEDPAGYRRAIDLVMESAGDPNILGTSGHILYVGRRDGVAEAPPSVEKKLMEPASIPVNATAALAERYGAVELKRVYNRNLLIALGISVALHGAIIGYYLFGGDDTEPSTPKIVLDDLRRPDTNWSIPVTLTKPQGGGGSPDVDKPLGRASKGAPNATPDRTHDNVDKDRSVIIRNPDKIRPVDKEPAPVKVAGNTRDTSARSNAIGTNGQNPNGVGNKPAGGSGGPGIGVGVGAATGLGSRGWVVRPHASYPGGLNATGTVMLRFTVLPNGDITNITPVKRADQALVNAAIAGLRRAKARPLPDNVPQIAQIATIPFTFELK